MITEAVAHSSAQQAHSAHEQERLAYRTRTLKIVLGILLAIAFGFATPYYLQTRSDDLAQDAANEAQVYEGSLSRQIAMPLVTVMAVLMLWRFRKRGRFGSPLMYAGIGYCVIVLASAVWTSAPQTTDKRLVVFAMLAFTAYALARTASVTELALWGATATGTVALMSLFAEIFIQHQFAPGDPDYRFTGLMTANYQAMNLLMFLFCSLTLMQKRPRWTGWIASGMAVALVLLFITRSRLSSIIGIVLIATMLTRIARQRMRAQGRALVVILVLTIALPPLVYLVGNNQGEGAAMGAFMMGRTDTENTSNLSNRAPLWSELWESVEQRPWLGYGYAGFWTPARVDKVSLDQGWTVPHAHNTYLDQTLSIGFPGALLYLASVWGAAIIAWRRHHHSRSAETLFPAVVLTWLALTGIAESVPLDPYLPTIIAYTCVVKMMMLEGSDTDATVARAEHPLVLSDGPRSLEAR